MTTIASRITDLFRRRKPVPPPSTFEPKNYWEARHRTHGHGLRSAGHLLLTDEENAHQYETKSMHLERFIRRHVTQPEGCSMLDAGCGTGLLAPCYKRLGFNVVGIDFSETAARRARQQTAYDSVVVSSLYNLGIQCQFDVIVTADVLLHIVNDTHWRDTISSLSHQLKPGGFWFVLDYCRPLTGPPSLHCRTRPVALLAKTLDVLGYTIVETDHIELIHENVVKDLLAITASSG